MGIVRKLILVFHEDHAAGGTHVHAPAASDASAVFQQFSAGDSHGLTVLRLHHAQDAHGLAVLAGVHAAAAFDALVAVAHQHAGTVVHGEVRGLRLKGKLADAELTGQILQFAEAVPDAVTEKAVLAEPGIQILDAGPSHAGAVMAVHRVLAEHVQQSLSPLLRQSGRIRGDLHACRHFHGAGQFLLRFPLHFHHAQAAGGVGTHALIGAQGRDLDPVGPGRLQDGGALRDLDLLIIDGNVDVFHVQHLLRPLRSGTVRTAHRGCR